MFNNFNITTNYQIVQDEIKKKCCEVGYNFTCIELILVTKWQAVEKLQVAYEMGLRNFGENQAQELIRKAEIMPKDICWHFIGRLQSNKVRKVVEYAQCIHSVDNLSLIKRLQYICLELDKRVDIYLQVNIGEDVNKQGFKVDEMEMVVELVKKQSHLNLLGLMTMGIKDVSDEENLNCFRRLKNNGNQLGLKKFSMGMSADYLLAIEAGTTCLRLGSVILGDRMK